MFTLALQLIVAISVIWVWIFKSENVDTDFNQFKLSKITQNLVGFSKMSASLLLIIGIWYGEFVVISAIILALFMIAAQYYHFKFGNPLKKKMPSLVLLLYLVIIIIFNL